MSDTSSSQGFVARAIGVVAFLLAFGVATIGGGVFLAAIWNVFFNLPERGEILKDHFGAMIGMPVAGALAFLLVVFLRQTEGPIEFKGAGFEFKGASGQIVMWIMCFLSITGAIKWLW
jgi:hypothetical protein